MSGSPFIEGLVDQGRHVKIGVRFIVDGYFRKTNLHGDMDLVSYRGWFESLESSGREGSTKLGRGGDVNQSPTFEIQYRLGKEKR